ncbi:MAG TPA: 4Fe-4S binding protein [Candidatus Limiplasma sp.]|nr:4Fe-4S binding protein [Candidatus Limiplasma sp.]HPS81483.1 4Fe-4S binding protein [Candidatus Limiplasma sp.]
MLRKIIEINEEKCNGCGACANACHEGAIGMVNGKAKLLRDDYCDGLGNCLPACPTGAIAFVEREAAAFDEQAVAARKTQNEETLACGCPGTHARAIHREPAATEPAPQTRSSASQLSQWPVQIKLVPVNAPYFHRAKLLVAADCTAFAYANFHEQFIKNHVTLIGCPKLDAVDYAEKLTAILSQNEILSITVVRMEVPCCGGIEHAVRTALQASGKMIPWQVVTIATDGRILE